MLSSLRGSLVEIKTKTGIFQRARQDLQVGKLHLEGSCHLSVRVMYS